MSFECCDKYAAIKMVMVHANISNVRLQSKSFHRWVNIYNDQVCEIVQSRNLFLLINRNDVNIQSKKKLFISEKCCFYLNVISGRRT